MKENKTNSPMADKTMVTPGTPKKNNMPMMLAGVVIILFIIAAIVGYFILNNKSASFDTPEEIQAYIEDAAEKLTSFDGTLSFTQIDSDGNEGESYSIDFKNSSTYGKSLGIADEFYLVGDIGYLLISDVWYSTPASDFGLDFGELSTSLSPESDTDGVDDTEFIGEVDCPNSNKTCNKIYNNDEDSTIYIEKSSGRIVYLESGSTATMLTYEKGNIEVPQDIIDEAVDYSELLPTTSTSDDDSDFDYDEFLDNLEDGDADYYEQYYQDLLDQYESEL